MYNAFISYRKKSSVNADFIHHCIADKSSYSLEDIFLDKHNIGPELFDSKIKTAIAENAHDVWATAQKKEGWTFGPERDDANKKHPDLVPYSSLPDSEKEYDRLMALDTIKLVKKLGFEIVKK